MPGQRTVLPAIPANFDWRQVLLVVLLVLVYYPAVTLAYGKMDTYSVYANVFFGNFDPFKSWIAIQGRPLTSVLTLWFFGLADSLDGLRFVRLFGLTGLLLFALLLYNLLKQYRYPPVYSFAYSLLLCVVPGFCSYTIWSVCFTYNWGSVLGLLAGVFLTGTPDKPDPTCRKQILGAVCLFLALCIYQPTALFCAIPIALWTFRSAQEGRSFPLSAYRASAVTCGVLGLYFVLFKFVYLKFAYEQVADSSRLNPPSDKLAQLKIIFTDAIPATVQGWSYFANGWFPVLVLLSVLGLILFASIQAIRKFPLRTILTHLAVFLFLIALTLIPIGYMSTGKAYFRLMAPFAAVTYLFLVAGIHYIVPETRRKGAGLVLLVLVLIHATAGASLLRRAWTNPAAEELNLYREHFAANVDALPVNLLVVPSDQWIYGIQNRRYLYGFLSSNQGWAMQSMLRLVAAEQFGRESAAQMGVYEIPNVMNVPYTAIVDANQVIFGVDGRKPLPRTSIAGFKDVVPLPGFGKWLASDWLGIFKIITLAEEGPGEIVLSGFGKWSYTWEDGALVLWKESGKRIVVVRGVTPTLN